MIDLEYARTLLAKAVETQGRDFVYANRFGLVCQYSPSEAGRTETGCLVGVALDLAGETRHHNYTGNVGRLCMTFPDMIHNDAVDYFRIAQCAQDQGRTWGEAYDLAEGTLK